MTLKVRISRSLMDAVRVDLNRPHPFAAERVGFLFGELVGASGPLVLLSDYMALADERYINDPRSGARIDSDAIRGAMQCILDRRLGAFHVHMHHWPGRPKLSRMDANEIPKIVQGLCRAGTDLANGMLLLHDIESAAWVWLPGNDVAVQATVSVVGFPYQISGV